jgi:hypothetical protein
MAACARLSHFESRSEAMNRNKQGKTGRERQRGWPGIAYYVESWRCLLNNQDTEIGRDGVRVNKSPRISVNGNLYWNIRDIIFKPTAPSDEVKP